MPFGTNRGMGGYLAIVYMVKVLHRSQCVVENSGDHAVLPLSVPEQSLVIFLLPTRKEYMILSVVKTMILWNVNYCSLIAVFHRNLFAAPSVQSFLCIVHSVHCQLTTLSPIKCTVLFPGILYYNITLNTATCFDPLWDHRQAITLK
jgi:hypothetical protein